MTSHQAPWDHWDAMVRAARSVLGEPDAAGECAAEAMAQFLERSPDHVLNLEAFLVTVSKRRAVDRIRQAKRQRSRELRVALSTAADVADVAEAVVHRRHAEWVDAQARRLLRPEVYRLLTLVADGRPVAEAAAMVDMTPRAAESHLSRARATMRGVIARATLIVGGLAAAVRRAAARSAPVGTVAAAAVILGLVLSPRSGVSSLTPDSQPLPHPAPTPPAAGARVPVSASAPRRPALSTPRATPLPKKQVDARTPVGGVGLERRDDGSDADYVTRLLACVRDFELKPIPPGGTIGCAPG